ncbi:hypothetical protein E2C01_051523 [Portunus trituberculatus]|uniref:Uncharacterized protein n=1 Tax=Portunus trituberculatus TaxID=210409 RepID=A0A5B7GB77_PORTR|nr:hypothetical protein [Portunus trituberculatus]
MPLPAPHDPYYDFFTFAILIVHLNPSSHLTTHAGCEAATSSCIMVSIQT